VWDETGVGLAKPGTVRTISGGTADKTGRTTEIVGLTDDRAEQLLRFWYEQGVLRGEAAREWLPEVVCVLLDDADEIVGVNSIYEKDLPLVGGRRFAIYRSYLLPEAAGAASAMINAAFDALDEQHDSGGPGPIGLCVAVSDAEGALGSSEVLQPETELLYAGYLDDGRQAWIRYFDDAQIGPGLPNSPTLAETAEGKYPLEERYRLEPLAETDQVSTDDVLELWDRENAIAGTEANRRVHEVTLVALDRDGTLAGVSSAYLQRNQQLGMDLWYYRTYVAEEHRNSNIATQTLWANRDHLKRRFVDGEDRRAGGVIFELENEGLKSYFNRAIWMPAQFTFIGENERGDHVRVHWFPGASAPAPR
jgi:hypothetical protein